MTNHYYDITDRIPVLLSNPQAQQTYSPTGVAYDVAIGGQPFFLLNDDNNPFRSVTAQYRKQQIDQSREPGEQTLTGWWLRSQSSFHLGQGITFFEPAQDESLRFQYTYSKGCNVWDKGQITLLPNVFTGHLTTSALNTNGRPFQFARSIHWDGKDGILLADGYDIDKIDTDGQETHFVNYNFGTDYPVYGICDDGTYAYWVTNNSTSGKLEFYKKLLTLDYTTPGTLMFSSPGIAVTNAVLEYTKERIVAAINDKIYEISAAATSLPTAVYTHPVSDFIFTSITSSGAAIYLAGYSGAQSAIYKFTLSTAGAMPTLTSAITAAELPVGEKVFKIAYYLGSLAIGTSLGVRIAAVSDTDGSIAYGPLLFESEQPVYDICFRDKYVWAATNVDGNPGLTRINLGQQIGTLVYAYAWDLFDPDTTGRNTTACAFAGNTDQIIFTTAGITVGTSVTYKQLTSNVATLTTSTAHGLVAGDEVWVEGVGSPFNSTTGTYTVTATPSTTTFSYAKVNANIALTAVSPVGRANTPGSIYIQDPTELTPTATIRTGFVRYNTIENKIFKYLVPRFDASFGSLQIYSIDQYDVEYGLGTFTEGSTVTEVGINYPTGPQQYLGFKFVFNRSDLDPTIGPKFTGYQVKTLPGIPRQYLMQYPCSLFDSESDKYGNKTGYEGSAYDRLSTMKQLESNGDTLKIEDFRTGEVYTGIIEETDFINKTPTDKRYAGYGGLLLITVRTIT